MKKVLMFLGAAFLLLVGLAVLGGGYLLWRGAELDASSKAYLDETLPKIVTGWSAKELLDRASPELMRATTPAELAQFFQKLHGALGGMKQYQGVKGTTYMTVTTKDGQVIAAQYMARAEFERGPAEIKIRLIQHDGKWQYLYFYVDRPKAGSAS